MNPGQFLKNLERIVTGHGYKRHMSGVSIRDLTEANGAKLDNGSTPPYAALETNSLGVQVAHSTSFIGELDIVVPADYDESVDMLRFEFLCNSAGDTDTPTIDAAVYRKRAGAALSGDLGPVASAAVPTNTALAAWRTVNADGLAIQAEDHLHIEFTQVGYGSDDALNIYGLKVVYASDLAYYDDDDRSTR